MGACSSSTSPQEEINSNKLDLTHFHLGKHLGSGGFGSVFEARNKLNGQRFALKVIPKSNKRLYSSEMKKHFTNSLLNERAILIQNRHTTTKSLLKLEHAFQHKKFFYLLTSLVDDSIPINELLSQFIDHNIAHHNNPSQIIDEKVIVFYAAQLILAMENLHKRNIVHMDIKPENILVDNKGDLVLIDYGLGFVASKPIYVNKKQSSPTHSASHPASGISTTMIEPSMIPTPSHSPSPYHQDNKASSLFIDTHTTRARGDSNPLEHHKNSTITTSSPFGTGKNKQVTHTITVQQKRDSVHSSHNNSEHKDNDSHRTDSHDTTLIDELLLKTSGFIGGGTRGYQAPELLNSFYNVGPWADLFSFGATLYTLIHGHKLKRDWSDGMQLADAHGNEIVRYEYSEKLSPHLKSFLSSLLQSQPHLRLGVVRNNGASVVPTNRNTDGSLSIDYDIIKRHPLFNNIDWDQMAQFNVESPLSALPLPFFLNKNKINNESEPANIYENDNSESLEVRIEIEKDLFSHSSSSSFNSKSSKYISIDGWDFKTDLKMH